MDSFGTLRRMPTIILHRIFSKHEVHLLFLKHACIPWSEIKNWHCAALFCQREYYKNKPPTPEEQEFVSFAAKCSVVFTSKVTSLLFTLSRGCAIEFQRLKFFGPHVLTKKEDVDC